MAKEKDTEYNERTDTRPSCQTGSINERTNNTAVSTPNAADPDVEQASNSGMGDAAVNDEKLTKYTGNRSADA